MSALMVALGTGALVSALRARRANTYWPFNLAARAFSSPAIFLRLSGAPAVAISLSAKALASWYFLSLLYTDISRTMAVYGGEPEVSMAVLYSVMAASHFLS